MVIYSWTSKRKTNELVDEYARDIEYFYSDEK